MSRTIRVPSVRRAWNLFVLALASEFVRCLQSIDRRRFEKRTQIVVVTVSILYFVIRGFVSLCLGR